MQAKRLIIMSRFSKTRSSQSSRNYAALNFSLKTHTAPLINQLISTENQAQMNWGNAGIEHLGACKNFLRHAALHAYGKFARNIKFLCTGAEALSQEFSTVCFSFHSWTCQTDHSQQIRNAYRIKVQIREAAAAAERTIYCRSCETDQGS